MFPLRVVLRVNKRSPGDQEAYETIHRWLFEEHLSPREVVERLLERNWIGGVVVGENDIVSKGIAAHICYFNWRAMRLNKLVHCGIYRQPYKHELATDGIYFLKREVVMGSGRTYPIGTRIWLMRGQTATATAYDTAAVVGVVAGFEQVAILDANTNAVLGEDTIANGDKADLRRIGEYVLRVFNTGLTRNCSVYLSEMPTTQNKDCYRFGAEDAKGGEGVTVRKDRVRFDSFRLPYCATGHSSQGTDIDGRYCIHDIGAAHMSPKWFWTAPGCRPRRPA